MPLFTYIGTVSAETYWTDDGAHDGSSEHFRWVLLEGPFGLRVSRFFGERSDMSRAAQEMDTRVKAWRMGGPLPPLDTETKHRKPAAVLEIVKNGEGG